MTPPAIPMSARTLIISDVHGNLSALETVLAEPHDTVICLGDVVGYGPEPAACLRRLRAERAVIVQGNHDRALAENVSPGCRPAFEQLAAALAPLGEQQLTPDEKRYLADLPRWSAVDLGSVECLLVHATPSDPLYRYLGPDTSAWAAELQGSDDDVVFVGHTHIQFDLPVGSSRVINPGSLGQPKDGNPAAAYAVMDGSSITLRRADYPVNDTLDALRRRDVSGWVFETLAALLTTGRVPQRVLAER